MYCKFNFHKLQMNLIGGIISLLIPLCLNENLKALLDKHCSL